MIGRLRLLMKSREAMEISAPLSIIPNCDEETGCDDLFTADRHAMLEIEGTKVGLSTTVVADDT